MNALQIIEKLQDSFAVELEFLEKLKLHSTNPLTGHVYQETEYSHAHAGSGNQSSHTEKVYKTLHSHCELHLGLKITRRCQEAIYCYLQKHHPIRKDMECVWHSNVLSPEYFFKYAIPLFNINETFFERVAAYALMVAAQEEPQLSPDTLSLSPDEVEEIAQKVQFNHFSLKMFSKSRNIFSVNQGESLLSFILLLNRIAGRDLEATLNDPIIGELDGLVAYGKKSDQIKKYAGVTMTALKSSVIRFDLDDDLAAALEEKARPFLHQFQPSFIPIH